MTVLPEEDGEPEKSSVTNSETRAIVADASFSVSKEPPLES